MSIKDIEAAVLKLVPKDRARLAGKLLESLEDLSEEESEIIWAQEAERRDAAWSPSADRNRTAKSVLRRARAKLSQ
jgi:Putative addiction module component